jgi:hypothetical protein
LPGWNFAGISYEQVIEGQSEQGPERQEPLVELDGELVGDTKIIIELLSRRYGIGGNLMASPTPRINLYAPKTLAVMDQAFAAIWNVLKADDPFRDYAKDGELRIAVGNKSF